jgi:hypothetical protein
VPKTAVPATVDASLTTFEEPQTRERFLAVAGTPEMQQVVRDLARTSLQGALEGALEDPLIDREKMRQAWREVVTEAMRASLRTTADEVASSLGPAMRQSVVDTLGAPDVRDAVSATVSSATRAAVTSSFDLLEELHEHDIEPQVFARLRRLLTGIIAGAFGLGAGTSALIAWTLVVHRRAKQIRDGENRQLLVKTVPDASRGVPTT